jgi:uncharacterized OB-fold protein
MVGYRRAVSANRVPAVEGWFTLDDQPRLLGSRCRQTGTYFFPPQEAFVPVPGVTEPDLEPVELSRTGTLWSWAVNHYAPPEPYVSPDPFVPYTVCAVELDVERMVVLGQLAPGADAGSLQIGMEMELELGTLFAEGEGADATDTVVWMWRPVTSGRTAEAG